MRHRVAVAVLLSFVLAACSGVTTPTAPTGPTEAPQEPLKVAFDETRGSVVRIESASCDGYGQGTGFLTGDGSLVVTAAHVVEDAATVRIISNRASFRGRVIGIDPVQDVALVRVSKSLGTGLPWATEPVAERDEVGAIGFTGGESLSLKAGRVNGLNRKGMTERGPATGLVEFDSIADSGNSGGPVVDKSAQVAGVMVAGKDQSRYFVPSSTAAPLVEAWADNDPVSTPEADCVPFLTPSGERSVKIADAAMSGAAATLSTYAGAVNTGDYDTALAMFASPRDFEAFTRDTQSSISSDWTLRSASKSGDNPVLWYTFVTEQHAGQGPDGRESETCTQWSLDYTFSQVGGFWQIDKALAHWKDAGTSIPCGETWPAETPVAKADQPVANVGRLSDKVPDTGEVADHWSAVSFCDENLYYEGFAQRRASRFTENFSESGDSGGSVGIIVLTKPDTAAELMDELERAATACNTYRGSERWKTITAPQNSFDDAFAVASEALPGGLGGGTMTLVARRGRSIVAVGEWIYFMTPITDDDDVPDNITDAVRELLDVLPNG